MGRFDLTDRQWERLEPLLPPERPRTGRPNDEHRRIVNGILWVLRTGAPWRDLPERYGPVGTVSSRFYRWREAGIWDQVLAALQAAADARGEVDWDLHCVDATIVRAHQHAAGARRTGAVGGCGRGRGAGPLPGRVLDQGPPARRGRRQADHLRPDRGRAAREPDAAGLAGPQGTVRRPGRGRPRLRPRRVAGDKAFTGRPVRSFLHRRGIGAVIPTQKKERRRPGFDREAYR